MLGLQSSNQRPVQQHLTQQQQKIIFSDKNSNTSRVNQKKRKRIEVNDNKRWIQKSESPQIIDSDFSSFVTGGATTTRATVPCHINDRIRSFVTQSSSNEEFITSENEKGQIQQSFVNITIIYRWTESSHFWYFLSKNLSSMHVLHLNGLCMYS